MAVELAAAHREVPEGFIAVAEELPGANAQGATLDEPRGEFAQTAAVTRHGGSIAPWPKRTTRPLAATREPLRLSAMEARWTACCS